MRHAGEGGLFEGLSIWQEKVPERGKAPGGEGVLEAGKSTFGDNKYRQLQGTYPVISLSFANVKEASFSNARKKICQIIKNLYNS